MSRSAPRTSLADVVTQRDVLPGMADFYKDMKRELGVSSVKDLVPLSTQNDPVYLQPANVEKGEWFANIWRMEGEPEYHPRGFFYTLLGKGYKRPNGDPIENSTNAWVVVQKGSKWAQVLGLVPPEKVKDEKNPDPRLTVGDEIEEPLRPPKFGSFFLDDVRGGLPTEEPRIPQEVSWQLPTVGAETPEEFIEAAADSYIELLFNGVEYAPSRRQPYYLEVWAEKSGLLPEELLRRYNATIRPAGGGEFSLDMCRDPVQRADQRDQGLVVVIVTDFDPKGADMPKSAARKIELEAAIHGVEAHVHHAALTAEQVEKYDLPGEPGKVPEGSGHGVKAYEAHKELFQKLNGYPVEVNAFVGREPEAFRDELEQYLAPYYDDELGARIRESVSNAKQIARESFLESVDRDAVSEAFKEAEAAVDAYRDELSEVFDDAQKTVSELRQRHRTVVDETKLRDRQNDLGRSIDVDTRELVESVRSRWNLPRGRSTDPPAPPLLDTRRTIQEQIEHYHKADIRYGGGR